VTSPADLGGMPGFGPVEIEPNEPPFHHDWERRVLAMYLATSNLGRWNIDQMRAMRELMPRAEYLASSYYEVWLYGIERLLDDRGLVTRDEVAARRTDPAATFARAKEARVLAAADVERVMSNPRASRLDVDVPPRFAVGEAVLTRVSTPPGHTRLPQYVRGRRGVVTADHGVWIFADAAGQDRGIVPQHVYTVRFAATELWGGGANRRDSVYVDLWDDHLQPA
jgi:nitrile hydratase beta subunit